MGLCIWQLFKELTIGIGDFEGGNRKSIYCMLRFCLDCGVLMLASDSICWVGANMGCDSRIKGCPE
jgi:hypothetical protein